MKQQSERREDSRISLKRSLENLLQKNSNQMGATAMVLVDDTGRILAEHGEGHDFHTLAQMPAKDPLYDPARVQSSLLDPSAYIKRLNSPNWTKIWPFRLTRGVAYLVCVLRKERELLHAELESICAGVRRIQSEVKLPQR